MTFLISKTLVYLIVPPASLILLMAAGFLLLRSSRRLAHLLIGLGFLGLYLLSIGPVAQALIAPLEAYAPPLEKRAVTADAIVVLGSGVVDLSWAGLPGEPSGTGLARLVKGMILYRRYRLPLVLMGGNGDPSRDVTADADAMAHVAAELGISPKHLIRENRSRNTLEGARSLGGLIKGRRIILVTSAYHMKRAAGMFRKEGFQVTPAPTAYMTEARSITPYSFLPHASSLIVSSAACSEHISLFWYGLTDAISKD
jgi:uncharacterized SAM-binding protein YcdF (DUF218 family)